MNARRTEIAVSIDGVDISADANEYLRQLTYTDHEEDKTDDLQLSLDDREGIWLTDWLNSGNETKGAKISAVIIQKNFDSDGADRVLDCGAFSIDSVDCSGPPSAATVKATSLPFASAVRTATRVKAWENIKLSAIAGEIAGRSGMALMYESSYDPLYDRREQNGISDIAFLRWLCEDAGISLKVASGFIVLFDAADYEQKSAVTEIKRGEADVKGYRFGTGTNDARYKNCHVSYTDPRTGQTFEHTYTPRNPPEGAEQTLEINERVKSKEEARQLAMKRLRQKNKSEFAAEFTLVGDVRLVAGVTVEVIGWGMYDGKYIIETATHSVTASGYTLQVKLRRALEGY
jgi:phage protein D